MGGGAASGAPLRIRLDLSYDGGSFAGWSRQPGLRTVQGALEDALALITRSGAEPPRLTVAGRTDAGVHATGQVAHVDLDPAPPESHGRPAVESLARRLNGIAGRDGDLRVDRASVAPDGFDARFSAVWRRYEYRVADAEARHDPLRRASTLWVPRALDVAAMDAAAGALTGLHDWGAFCRPREGATTVRTLLDFSWRRDAEGVAVAEVRADAFCHSMVRALVGASLAVGSGRLAPDRLIGIRDAARRGSEFAVVPPHGLTLVEVGYPPDAELAARAELTRARRQPV